MKNELMRKEAVRYVKEVKRQMLCPKKMKNDMLLSLENSIMDYMEEHPEASAQEIETHFGKPQQIAVEYIASLDQNELRKEIQKSKLIKKMIVFLAVGILLIAAVTSVVVIVWNANTQPDIIYHEIVQ